MLLMIFTCVALGTNALLKSCAGQCYHSIDASSIFIQVQIIAEA